MAEVLTELPPVRTPGRRARGALDKYLDGQIWKLTNGVDFKTKNWRSAQGLFRCVASRNGKSLAVRMVSDNPIVIVVQARPKA